MFAGSDDSALMARSKRKNAVIDFLPYYMIFATELGSNNRRVSASTCPASGAIWILYDTDDTEFCFKARKLLRAERHDDNRQR